MLVRACSRDCAASTSAIERKLRYRPSSISSGLKRLRASMNSLSAGIEHLELESRNACQNIGLAAELCDLAESYFEDACERSFCERHPPTPSSLPACEVFQARWSACPAFPPETGRNAFQFTQIDQVCRKNSVSQRRQFLGDALGLFRVSDGLQRLHEKSRA